MDLTDVIGRVSEASDPQRVFGLDLRYFKDLGPFSFQIFKEYVE